MKLQYRILWIENDEDWAESVQDEIQEFIEEQGFKYDMKLLPKEEVGVRYEDYDIILMDLNLADQPNGAELIRKIRELGAYTDVVFYSADGIDSLKEKGREKELEGVFYTSRTPNVSFTDKVISVIKSTIKKVQDLNNLRGLVMAEVSELDVMMDQIIKSYFVTEDRMNAFHKHITKNRETTIKKSLMVPEDEACKKNCSLEWRKKNIDEIEMDSSQKARAIKVVLEGIDSDEKLYPHKCTNFYQSFLDEVISMRNNLAHCDSIVDANGNEILRTRKGDISFNNEDFIQIRKNITKYHSLFESVIMSVKE